ncbi:hypothetical protein ACFOZY_13045 [Chungangia koreensis]|uniref:Uncharacterized protein n=1 Tax=Chungangia koreensis TaxID=752657 RepID=A0ABV8X7U8_9LACT
MLDVLLLMPFLYFPEDKSQYIPSVLWLLAIILLCVLFFRWLKKYSQKEQMKTKELEERILRERQQENEKERP